MSVKISELPFNSTYTGSEKIPIVQDATTRAGTLSSLATYLSAFYSDPIVTALSGNWNESYTIVAANSANWDAAYALVDFSSSWNSTYSNVRATSGSWSSVYSNVRSNSANWDAAYNLLGTVPNWNSTYSNVRANSGSWNSVFSNVNANSAFYALDANVLKLTGGTIGGNLTITGNLTATGSSYFTNTIFSATSALSVVHVGEGPAVWVGNNGTGDIASFYDIDTGVEVLHVGGDNGTFPNVGIKTSTPNKTLTVSGEISASNTIWDSNGNSNNWNSVYSRVRTLSSTWIDLPTATNYLSTNNVILSSATILDTLSARTYINNPTGKTIYVDAGVGTDTRTGLLKYDQFKPFATLSAATAASVTGDLVYVRAGSYFTTSQINLNGEGSLYFEPGATVTIPTGVVAFSYSQNSIPIYIKGHADFVLEGSAGVLTMPGGNAATSVGFECNSISGLDNVTGTLFNCTSGNLSVDAKTIAMTTSFTASSATVFNITGDGKVTAKIPYVYCGRFVTGAGTAFPGNAVRAQINADVWTLATYNAAAGMNLSLITTNFRIVNYNHVGVGAALSWTENTTFESHAFRGITWGSSAGQPNITFASTNGSTTNKIIRLSQTNILRGAATNSLSSNVPINVGTYGTFASAPATSNVTFKIGSFTVDADVNTY